ncbi:MULTISPECIES: Flp family type IVb pilin [unclassified Methylobacterium]|uniref:Flp family type IVb pilin n=1 Tax=unclassified Methylobacterium TaxID=2615210 RepID=UPI0009E82BD2|nr:MULTISPECIES: Flp family type IVb pilin [unclassified Methylobacterium]
MSSIFKRFSADESGATAIEYGLIAALISAVLVAVFGTLSDNITTGFGKVGTTIAGTTK